MIALHDYNDYDNLIPFDLADDAWGVTHEFNGNDTLEFELSPTDELYKYVQEEVKVEFTGGRSSDSRFIIKNVDEHSDLVTVTCSIDLDDWQQKVYASFRETNSYLSEILDIIKPTGWTYLGADQFGKRTTVGGSNDEPLYAVTPLEILDECQDAYGVVFNFDVIGKVLHCIDSESYTASGEFFSDELNLKSIGYVGNSDNFATRLYAYGKRDDETGKPLTFASINGGKEYVEDHSYSERVVCIGWSDDRYEDKQSLLNDAKAKLAEMAKPVRSYECEVSAMQSNVWLYKVVTIIDRKRSLRIDHQIISWVEHGDPSLDSVTVSAVAPTIDSLIDKAISDADSLRDDMEEGFLTITKEYQEAIEHATDMITGSYGGYFKWVFDDDGNPMELVNLGDTEDINTARKVWRWNKNGLGHSNNGYNGSYDLALLADGSINASMITTGTLNAVRIKAGVLQDVKGLNYWNLETGQFRLTSSATVGGQTVQTIANNAATSKWNSTTQRDVFNKLTNNGTAQGIYMSGSQLYINGEYIKANTVSTNKIESYRGSSLYTTVGTTVCGNSGTSFVNSSGNYCDIEAMNAVDDTSGKTTGFGLAVFDKPILHCSTYYDQLWLHPPIYKNTYLQQPPEQVYLRSASGSGAGKDGSYVKVQRNSNCGLFLGQNSTLLQFDETHYISITASNGVQCRCGSKGFGWSNGAFSESLIWG